MIENWRFKKKVPVDICLAICWRRRCKVWPHRERGNDRRLFRWDCSVWREDWTRIQIACYASRGQCSRRSDPTGSWICSASELFPCFFFSQTRGNVNNKKKVHCIKDIKILGIVLQVDAEDVVEQFGKEITVTGQFHDVREFDENFLCSFFILTEIH